MNKFKLKNPYFFKKIHFFKHIFNKHHKYKSKINKSKNKILFEENIEKNNNITENLLQFKENLFYNSLLLNDNKIKKKLLLIKSTKIFKNKKIKLFFKHYDLKSIFKDNKFKSERTHLDWIPFSKNISTDPTEQGCMTFGKFIEFHGAITKDQKIKSTLYINLY